MANRRETIKADCPVLGCEKVGYAEVVIDDARITQEATVDTMLDHHRNLLTAILQKHHDDGHPKEGK